MEPRVPFEVLCDLIRRNTKGSHSPALVEFLCAWHIPQFSVNGEGRPIKEVKIRVKARELVKHVTGLLDSNEPELWTLQYQVSVAEAAPDHQARLERETIARDLVQELVEPESFDPPLTKDDTYRKLMMIAMLRSPYGVPTNVVFATEASTAMQSLLDIPLFMAQSPETKKASIPILVKLMTGILVYSSDTSASHASLIPSTIDWIDKLLSEKPFPPIASSTGVYGSIFFLSMISNLRLAKKALKKLKIPDLKEAVALVDKVCRYRGDRVPVESVYPHLLTLSDVFEEARQMLDFVSFQRSLVRKAEQFLTIWREYTTSLGTEQADLQGDSNKIGLEVHFEDSLPQQIAHLSRKVTYSNNPGTVSFNGICPYTLSTTGKPAMGKIGHLLYKGGVYRFKDVEAMRYFTRDPDFFIDECHQLAISRHPSLVFLLGIQEQHYPILSTRSLKSPDGKQTQTSSTQTRVEPSVLGPGPVFWNTRQLATEVLAKREYLQTHRVCQLQTSESHFRRSNEAQAWVSKNGHCQTKRDNGSEMPAAHPGHYAIGLLYKQGRKMGGFQARRGPQQHLKEGKALAVQGD